MRLFSVTMVGYHVWQHDIDQENGENFMSGGHGHVDTSNKKIALLVAILAALLAISEMGGKSSQTNALSSHIDASNLWTFFQAKTIRQTTMRTAAEEAEATFKDSAPGMPAAMKAQTERWRQTAQRYESEPETGEGRKELMARAKAQGADPRQVAGRLPHVRIRLGGVPAGDRAGRRGGADDGHVADIHLGGPGRRRCGVHDPGLRGADPGPSLAPKKRPAARAAGTSFELWRALFSGAGRPWPA